MKECFIVVHSNYDEGMSAYAFKMALVSLEKF